MGISKHGGHTAPEKRLDSGKSDDSNCWRFFYQVWDRPSSTVPFDSAWRSNVWRSIFWACWCLTWNNFESASRYESRCLTKMKHQIYKKRCLPLLEALLKTQFSDVARNWDDFPNRNDAWWRVSSEASPPSRACFQLPKMGVPRAESLDGVCERENPSRKWLKIRMMTGPPI